MQNEPAVKRLLVWARVWRGWNLTPSGMVRVAFSREDAESSARATGAYVPRTMFARNIRLPEERARAVWMEIGGTRGLALRHLSSLHHHERLGITIRTRVRFLARGSR
jgi:hypothetical protein